MSEEEEVKAQLFFDTCKYRSTEQEEVGEFSCCTNNLHMAFICFRRNIEDLESSHCLDCPVYKEKNYVN